MAFFVCDIMPTPPQQFENDTQRCIYETLAQLGIEYLRVDTDDGSTMEDCIHISQGLQCPVVKTILLCNRQQTKFYMYVTTGEKPFVTKEFCGALGIPRVSFAPTEMLLEKLGTRMGATTVLSLIHESRGRPRHRQRGGPTRLLCLHRWYYHLFYEIQDERPFQPFSETYRTSGNCYLIVFFCFAVLIFLCMFANLKKVKNKND